MTTTRRTAAKTGAIATPEGVIIARIEHHDLTDTTPETVQADPAAILFEDNIRQEADLNPGRLKPSTVERLAANIATGQEDS